MSQQQREDTPKTGPAPSNRGATLGEDEARPKGTTQGDLDRARKPGPDAGHEEIGQFPDSGDFGPDDIGNRRA